MPQGYCIHVPAPRFHDGSGFIDASDFALAINVLTMHFLVN